jgi:hypothetical protein
MQWGWSRCTLRAAACFACQPVVIVGAACAIILAGCKLDGQPNVSVAQPRGASVAFESIDGPPPGQFQTLVEYLNNEAQTRRLAVVSRDHQSAYRVRGYLAAEMDKGKTTISWVWDVFDTDQRRALRISGAETIKGKLKGWQAANDAMLQRIAQTSMNELATFLTSPEVAPNAPAGPKVAAAAPAASSPEATGIFRIFRPLVDPLPAKEAEVAPGSTVPLPPRRPASVAAVPAQAAVTLAATGEQ